MDFTTVDYLRKLLAIEKAGLLPELERALAHQRRHIPRNPFDADQWLQCDVDYLARIGARITGDSLRWCRRHATEVLADTHRANAIRLIDEFYSQIDRPGREML